MTAHGATAMHEDTEVVKRPLLFRAKRYTNGPLSPPFQNPKSATGSPYNEVHVR